MKAEEPQTVANTGPVVDPADAVRIFQPFQRLSDRTSMTVSAGVPAQGIPSVGEPDSADYMTSQEESDAPRSHDSVTGGAGGPAVSHA